MNEIDQYLNKLSPEYKEELQRIRSIIKTEAPEAEESISYDIPAFKLKGKPLIYFAAFKDHLSLFPTSGPIAELEDDLKKYTTGKGTLSYKIDEPFPESLLKKILHVRTAQIG